jgi:hypothetical protein
MVSDTIFPAMPDASRWLEFVRLAAFIRDAKGLLDEDDVARLEHELMENPTAGAVIEGTGGFANSASLSAIKARGVEPGSFTITGAKRGAFT